MRYWFYILIGFGVTLGLEVRLKQDFSYPNRVIYTVAWPTIVAAGIVTYFPKKEEK